MITENKKRTDYTKSAVNLCNDPFMGDHLTNLAKMESELEELKGKVNSYIPPEFVSAIEQMQIAVDGERDFINRNIDVFGSYQDLNRGFYAIKQRKSSKSYDPMAFETRYPEYAKAVIIKAVDVTKLSGLIKGGLISEDDLRKESPGGYPAVVTEKESFAYIVRVETETK